MTKEQAALEILNAISPHYGVGYMALMVSDLNRVVRARKLTARHKDTLRKASQAATHVVGLRKALTWVEALKG